MPDRAMARATELEDAAHAAYEETADLLRSEHGYEKDEALALSRVFVRRVERWIESDEPDLEQLRERLEASQPEWELAGDVSA